MTKNDIVQKLWNQCDILRDDGINYSHYVTELVLLLFMKMENEQVLNQSVTYDHRLPEGCRWADLRKLSGVNLLDTYKRILLTLSSGKDADGKTVVTDPLILAIYNDAQTSLREPKHLEQLIKNLDQIDWFSAQQDGLGDLYEGLLEKNANETKSGAGQYFTPRPLIDSIIRCIKPQPGETIQDPAAGTAGFLIAADSYIKSNTDDLYDLSAKEQKRQRKECYIGIELVPDTRRLALMNCLLHGMEGDAEGVVHLGNALGQAGENLKPSTIILSNPPFGTAKGGGNTTRVFTYKTSNKQLTFLQHIYNGLKPGGRAAVVLPDNVLFEAGVGTDVRRDLMDKCNLHTILRLPTGIFYAQGVKTNVLFFTRGETDEGNTKKVWVYDLRNNMPSFGKRTPFGEEHLKPFEKVYGKKADGTSKRTEGEWSFTSEDSEQSADNSRWRCFDRDWIRDTKGDSLDISWIKDKDSVDAADLPEPDELAAKAMGELTEALRELDGLLSALCCSDKAAAQKTMLAEVLGIGAEVGE
ncbi:class I SAM-dependent DNA methyltransferase [Tichowtungia aerotolerans]|uniref:site-specific DNA-methyltransferase (adenine-specific) n=1 Tax=Tichowtungia aerotolerans TaxID=2697043 RepID=A0A6P1M8P1_9BACT|nr:N-6 DNA methylase [Tichowtungia aerotolerans]QHI68894.1 N-6 DNA methylase [Tichowtungia aerotolerans]